MENVKALTFDVFGTVVDWRGSIIEEFRALGRERSLSIDCEAFVDEWKSGYKPGMDAVRAGKTVWTNVEGIYRRKLEELLPRYGIRGLTEQDKVRLTRVWHRLNPWPDVVLGLIRLKSKYIIATLSNGDVACLVHMAKRAGLPWDCILCAEIFRHYKPDAEVYRGAIELLARKPEEAMMVASHNYDLKAARSHGMRTAFVPRPLESGPGQKTDLEPEENWDIVAEDFADLAARLGT